MWQGQEKVDALAQTESRLHSLSADGFLSAVAWSMPTAVGWVILTDTRLTLTGNIVTDIPRNSLLEAASVLLGLATLTDRSAHLIVLSGTPL